MVLYFTTISAVAGEIPANAVLTIDPGQRKLTRGQTYAFRDADGDFFICRIENVGKAKRGVVARDGCVIIGRVVSWVPARLH